MNLRRRLMVLPDVLRKTPLLLTACFASLAGLLCVLASMLDLPWLVIVHQRIAGVTAVAILFSTLVLLCLILPVWHLGVILHICKHLIVRKSDARARLGDVLREYDPKPEKRRFLSAEYERWLCLVEITFDSVPSWHAIKRPLLRLCGLAVTCLCLLCVANHWATFWSTRQRLKNVEATPTSLSLAVLAGHFHDLEYYPHAARCYEASLEAESRGDTARDLHHTYRQMGDTKRLNALIATGLVPIPPPQGAPGTPATQFMDIAYDGDVAALELRNAWCLADISEPVLCGAFFVVFLVPSFKGMDAAYALLAACRGNLQSQTSDNATVGNTTAASHT